MDSRSLIVLLVACAGPRPSVDHVAVTASPQPGFQRVSAMLHNRGGGGEVTVDITLRGKVVLREQRTVEMHGGDAIAFVADVLAPPDSYEASIEVTYPD